MNTITILGTVVLAAALHLASAHNVARADQTEPLSLGPFEVMPGGEDVVEVGIGLFNVFRDRDGTGNEGAGSADLEYRPGKRFYYLGVVVGGMATVDGGAIAYLGNYVDIRFEEDFYLTPMLAIGAYRTGGGKDLGGTLQFRSAVTFAYEMKDRSRIGVRFAHVSNAGLHDINPGVNEIYLTYGFLF